MNERFILFLILIATFISIIIFSFSNRNIIVNYNYFETIKIDNTNQVDAIIGIVNLNNKKFLPAKITLKKLKACIFNKKSKFTYDIYYSNSNKKFALNRNEIGIEKTFEVPTLSTKQVYIKLTLKFPILRDNLEKSLYYDKIPKKNLLYLFDEKKIIIKDKKFVEFCNNVNINQSFYKISIINNI